MVPDAEPVQQPYHRSNQRPHEAAHQHQRAYAYAGAHDQPEPRADGGTHDTANSEPEPHPDVCSDPFAHAGADDEPEQCADGFAGSNDEPDGGVLGYSRVLGHLENPFMGGGALLFLSR